MSHQVSAKIVKDRLEIELQGDDLRIGCGGKVYLYHGRVGKTQCLYYRIVKWRETGVKASEIEPGRIFFWDKQVIDPGTYTVEVQPLVRSSGDPNTWVNLADFVRTVDHCLSLDIDVERWEDSKKYFVTYRNGRRSPEVHLESHGVFTNVVFPSIHDIARFVQAGVLGRIAKIPEIQEAQPVEHDQGRNRSQLVDVATVIHGKHKKNSRRKIPNQCNINLGDIIFVTQYSAIIL